MKYQRRRLDPIEDNKLLEIHKFVKYVISKNHIVNRSEGLKVIEYHGILHKRSQSYDKYPSEEEMCLLWRDICLYWKNNIRDNFSAFPS